MIDSLRSVRAYALIGLCVAVLPLAGGAQVSPGIISTEAVGEATAAADEALVRFGVSVRSETAAAAAAEMAAVIGRVRDSLQAAGIPRDSVPTTGYAVYPIRRAPRDPRDTSVVFDASTSVSAKIRDFDAIGRIITAVLGAGATNVQGISFGASDTGPARVRAIALAVADARRDAEALARAAGVTLGGLVELSTASAPAAPMFDAPVMQASAARFQEGAIEVVPQDIVVHVRVTARWRVAPD